VWGNLVWGSANFEECFIALRMISVRYPLENSLEWQSEVSIYVFNYVIFVESVH
jgi:TRAP-type C4-dicarboxylate transport system permease small subunit